MKKRELLAIVNLFLLAPPVASETVRIATWNVRDAFSVQDVSERASEFAAMASEIGPDILLVQEVTSLAVVEEIRKRMGDAYKNAHVVCSDFNQDDFDERSSFEVGIISKFPFGQVLEFDPTPDNSQFKVEPPEDGIVKVKNVNSASTSRGYLWAELPELGLTVANAHLKSSRGEQKCSERKSNAKKRERIAAAMAAGVVEDSKLFKGYTFVVAGDLNVGHAASKNGVNLKVDCCGSNCSGKDSYDETHALLGGGLVSGLKMRNLAGHLNVTSFPGFSANSPIDNIYVSGANKDKFAPAVLTTSTFGSDHLVMWTDYSF